MDRIIHSDTTVSIFLSIMLEKETLFSFFIPVSIQRFINWQAAAIHQTDPGALVTVGSWSEHAITDSHTDSRNSL